MRAQMNQTMPDRHDTAVARPTRQCMRRCGLPGLGRHVSKAVVEDLYKQVRETFVRNLHLQKEQGSRMMVLKALDEVLNGFPFEAPKLVKQQGQCDGWKA